MLAHKLISASSTPKDKAFLIGTKKQSRGTRRLQLPIKEVYAINLTWAACMTTAKKLLSNEEAIKWFQMEADQGHAGAQVNLVMMFERGKKNAKTTLR
jgi:TPR repeat protein